MKSQSKKTHYKACSPQLLERLGENLRVIRIDKGFSQEDLAHAANTHRTFISLIERSKRNVTLGAVEGLADALGVDIIDLLRER